eukprot:gb/GFBE01027898.1/.p1 GENE.gb/GFBE01027898.1/~~gb/GFBE01027898.1/.p1  ORF type:complete len:258 (+),score=25.27 gb/GFBE01027898.1/:1-774(+)
MSWFTFGSDPEEAEGQEVIGEQFGGSSSSGSGRPMPVRSPGPSADLPLASGRKVYRERVLVRVYDLGQTLFTRWHNKLTKDYGAFHTGVEVYGREWSFGMTLDDFSSGITSGIPGKNTDHAFRETLSMGYTRCSPREVGQILEDMKRDWRGTTYNVLSKNCHNFSDAFCARLGVARLPSWVNTLASTGAVTVDYLDSADSGYDGGTAIADFFDNVKSTVFGAFASNSAGQDARHSLRDSSMEDRRYHGGAGGSNSWH